jgi:hypothetical protein
MFWMVVFGGVGTAQHPRDHSFVKKYFESCQRICGKRPV